MLKDWLLGYSVINHIIGIVQRLWREAFSVVRLTAKFSATSFFVMFGSNSMAAAFFTSASDMAGFRPPFRPRARAACNPAIVLSQIRSCSNSAKAPKIWNTKRPPELVVLMDSVSDLKPISRSWSSWTISTRSFSERASRCAVSRPPECRPFGGYADTATAQVVPGACR